MNILPLIMALVLIISVLTVERLEKFKNHSAVQNEYQAFIKENERQVFNRRERNLYGDAKHKSFRQLTIRYLYDKKARDKHANEAKQYRVLLAELIKIVYGDAGFYKELIKKNSDFVEDMFKKIEEVAENVPHKVILQTKDLARLDLGDPELQEAFYHILKGTILREKLLEMENMTPRMKEKAYVSLLTYVHNHGKEDKPPPAIRIALAPREILKAIFIKDEIVEAIILKREELGGKDRDSGADEMFKSEFINKRRPGLDENLLDFKLSSNSDEYR